MALLLMSGAGCQTPVEPGDDGGAQQPADASVGDAGSDAGAVDAGSDAGAVDAGAVDAGAVDAGAVDAGRDAGAVDAGTDGGLGAADAGAATPPSLAQVGPRSALTSRSGGSLPPGNYTGQRFTTAVQLASSGTYTFSDCDFAAGIETVFGGSTVTRSVTLDHCLSTAIYFEDGGQKNWTIRWSHLVGGNQALRPKGLTYGDVTYPTPLVVEDSILEITNLGTPAAHVEAMQSLGGRQMRFSRVRFITLGPYQNGITGQTASVNYWGADGLFEDCEFLDANAYYYTLYTQGPNNVFRRCRFGKGLASYVYKDASSIPATFVGCTDLSTGGAVTAP
ncbi:MAG: hypothetical protein IPJ65_37815 [Archangiaceae bacterium]|nr:hypothetical protein [Archangiaceae bacterium]